MTQATRQAILAGLCFLPLLALTVLLVAYFADAVFGRVKLERKRGPWL